METIANINILTFVSDNATFFCILLVGIAFNYLKPTLPTAADRVAYFLRLVGWGVFFNLFLSHNGLNPHIIIGTCGFFGIDFVGAWLAEGIKKLQVKNEPTSRKAVAALEKEGLWQIRPK